MYNFKGEIVSRKKVDLRGSSRGEENREQVLQRTRREREKRKRQKLEHESATIIQATWRASFAVRSLKAELKQSWVHTYGQEGELLGRSCLLPASTCIPQLLLAMDISNPSDRSVLCEVCKLVLETQEASGGLSFCHHAQEDSSIVTMRTAKLLMVCLDVLEHNRLAFFNTLASKYDQLDMKSEVGVFVKFIESLTTPATWSPFIEGEAATTLTDNLGRKLALNGMYTALASLIRHTCPIREGAYGVDVSYSTVVEHLGLHLTQLHCRTCDTGNQVVSFHRGPLQILTVGCLWRRCPSLKVMGSYLCRKGIPHDTSIPIPDILKRLLVEGERPVDVALAFLGNVAQLGGRAVLQGQFRNDDHPDFCSRMANMISELLIRLPLAKLFSMDIITDDEEEEDEAGPSYLFEMRQSEWDATEVAADLVLTAQDLFATPGQELLEGLVQGILPHTQHVEDTLEPGIPEGAAGVCKLLQLLLKTRNEVQRQKLLLSLALSGKMVERLWYSFLRNCSAMDIEGLRDSGGMNNMLVALGMLCQVYSCFLVTAGSEELCRKQEPLALKELHNIESSNSGLIVMLKNYLWQVTWLAPGSGTLSRVNLTFMRDFQYFAGKLLGQLYDCNARWKFAPPEAFHISNGSLLKFVPEATAVATALDDSGEAEPEDHSRAWQILNHAACLIPFPDRAKVFTAQVEHDRNKHRALSGDPFMNDGNRFITIRRSQLLYDGFSQLNGLGEELKSKVRIRFIDEHGLTEAGVDGGGLFKDFMEELVRMGFDPQYGLFTSTEDNQLYPNPSSPHLMPDALDVLGFLGRMLGKAVYEGMLLELPLAGFFLKKFRSSHCDINDLPTLDPELYRQLVMLRNYQGDVGELSLNFTVVDSVYGSNQEVELKPGGKEIPVVNSNAIEYIHRVADFRLNKQVQSVSRAFLSGFFSVIRPDWVKMFSAAELQELISGSEEGLNLADMQANVEYAGGYHEEHPVIKLFWQSLVEFTPDEQRRFLRFVTACSRAPLLGFQYLQPKICIQMAGSVLEPESLERLPTAATCMNILKLPPYTTKQMMQEKLLYSVNSGAGFDLS